MEIGGARSISGIAGDGSASRRLRDSEEPGARRAFVDRGRWALCERGSLSGAFFVLSTLSALRGLQTGFRATRGLPSAATTAILAPMPSPKRTRERGPDTAKRASKVNQPHDRLIKFAFSNIEHASGLLRAALSAEIVPLIVWSTLRLEDVHYIDRALRGRYADLLFSAQMGEDNAYFYVLLEHQR